MHTRHAGIESTWTQKISGKKYIRIFVWNSAEEMHKAESTVWYMKELRTEHCGRCSTFHQAVTGKRVTSGRKFAEIHLVREMIGAGYVSHEFYHLVNYWSNFKNLHPRDNTKHDERMAWLTGELVSKFWVEFYKRYDSHGENLT